MKNLILFASITLASGMLFTNLYTSLVDAKSWGANIPDSIVTARAYYKVVNPGFFFRIFSPVNQLLGILAVILFWKSSPSIRLYLVIACVMYMLAEGLTFMYFYPRNDIMFRNGDLNDIALLKRVWAEWSFMNWIRSGVIVAGIFFSYLSLHKIYSLN